jgi:hypothetical protein
MFAIMTSFLTKAIAPQSPTHWHWSVLRAYLQSLKNERMEPDEFLKNWDVSREELAFICECSLTTINHWFSQGEHRRTPSEKHKQRLALAHHIWVTIESEPEYLKILREMYNKKSRRRWKISLFAKWQIFLAFINSSRVLQTPVFRNGFTGEHELVVGW